MSIGRPCSFTSGMEWQANNIFWKIIHISLFQRATKVEFRPSVGDIAKTKWDHKTKNWDYIFHADFYALRNTYAQDMILYCNWNSQKINSVMHFKSAKLNNSISEKTKSLLHITMFDISQLRRLVKTPNSGLHEVELCQKPSQKVHWQIETLHV